MWIVGNFDYEICFILSLLIKRVLVELIPYSPGVFKDWALCALEERELTIPAALIYAPDLMSHWILLGGCMQRNKEVVEWGKTEEKSQPRAISERTLEAERLIEGSSKKVGWALESYSVMAPCLRRKTPPFTQHIHPWAPQAFVCLLYTQELPAPEISVRHCDWHYQRTTGWSNESHFQAWNMKCLYLILLWLCIWLCPSQID